MGYIEYQYTSSSGSWYFEKYGCFKAYSAVILFDGSYSNNYLNKSMASLDAFGNNFLKSLPGFLSIYLSFIVSGDNGAISNIYSLGDPKTSIINSI